jgi:hypothetical protein
MVWHESTGQELCETMLNLLMRTLSCSGAPLLYVMIFTWEFLGLLAK